MPSGTLEDYHAAWGLIIDEVQSLSDSKKVQFLLLFFYAIILMLRFFKAFQGED
jgi:hypothetical protein